MKTKINEFVQKIDEAIPDATPETVKKQAKEIKQNAKNSAVCMFATGVCIYKTVDSSVTLALMIGKTSTKKAANVMTSWYAGTPAMIVRR